MSHIKSNRLEKARAKDWLNGPAVPIPISHSKDLMNLYVIFFLISYLSLGFCQSKINETAQLDTGAGGNGTSSCLATMDCKQGFFCHPEERTCRIKVKPGEICIVNGECAGNYLCVKVEGSDNSEEKRCLSSYDGGDVATLSLTLIIVLVVSGLISCCCLLGLVAIIMNGLFCCGSKAAKAVVA